jgi:membrane associated rhomboid family serine protease
VGLRFPRTATNVIVALTALAWVIAVLLGQSAQAAYSLGFLPIRVSIPNVPFPAAPVYLTPLTATLVHSNLVHLGFNMLILLWCG